MAINMSRMVKFANAFPVAAIVSTLSAKYSRHMEQHLGQAHQEGHKWGDRAILCADWKTMDLCADALAQRKLPFNVRKRSGDFNPGANAIQVMTMKVSKGLEFPVVALPGVGHMPAPGEDEKESARVFYVAATRATQRLLVTVSGDSGFGQRLNATALDGGTKGLQT